jgi:hypothetical protein
VTTLSWKRKIALYLPENVAHPPWQKRKIKTVNWENKNKL